MSIDKSNQYLLIILIILLIFSIILMYIIDIFYKRWYSVKSFKNDNISKRDAHSQNKGGV